MGSENVWRKSPDGYENGGDVPHDVMKRVPKRVLGSPTVDEAIWMENDAQYW